MLWNDPKLTMSPKSPLHFLSPNKIPSIPQFSWHVRPYSSISKYILFQVNRTDMPTNGGPNKQNKEKHVRVIPKFEMRLENLKTLCALATAMRWLVWSACTFLHCAQCNADPVQYCCKTWKQIRLISCICCRQRFEFSPPNAAKTL